MGSMFIITRRSVKLGVEKKNRYIRQMFQKARELSVIAGYFVTHMYSRRIFWWRVLQSFLGFETFIVLELELLLMLNQICVK